MLGIPGVGATSVFVPLFDPRRSSQLIETYGVNWTTMVPTMIAMVLDHPEFRPERLAPLKDLVYGASPMPAALLDRLQSTFPELLLWQGYGMTECSSVLTILTAEDHAEGGEILRSAGRPLIGVNIRIEDDKGNVLPPARTARCAPGAATS